jgi:serine palmitoyltransferase
MAAHEDVILPWYQIVLVYISFTFIITLGYINEFFSRVLAPKSRPPKGYSPWYKDYEAFFNRRMYSRISDCWNRPIASAPGPKFDVIHREIVKQPLSWIVDNKKTVLSDKITTCLNLASYNYLGFADTKGKHIDEVVASVKKFGVSTCSPSLELGTTSLHEELGQLIARFVHKEAALIFGQGYATNSTNLPGLLGKGDLVISDSLNHASLVVGCRSSGCKVKVFAHNDMEDLERVIRESIVEGQPRTHRPWRKIMILVEGIYSMEGEICKLPDIVKLKKKYKCYLYVDEAHSIGALGKSGRGVCEYWGVDFADVDVLMGTFTKSFASVGGYIASSRDVIDHLREHSVGGSYETSMPPGNVQEAISCLKIITGEDGTDLGRKKVQQLHDNSNYFRQKLIDLGFQVFGEKDSPVIPMMLYYPAKISAFSRECLRKNLAVVVVGFPAVPLLSSRVRFCISAAHTREDLDNALKEIDQIGDRLMLKYGSRHH